MLDKSKRETKARNSLKQLKQNRRMQIAMKFYRTMIRGFVF